jgi:hypothetical protein
MTQSGRAFEKHSAGTANTFRVAHDAADRSLPGRQHEPDATGPALANSLDPAALAQKMDTP